MIQLITLRIQNERYAYSVINVCPFRFEQYTYLGNGKDSLMWISYSDFLSWVMDKLEGHLSGCPNCFLTLERRQRTGRKRQIIRMANGVNKDRNFS